MPRRPRVDFEGAWHHVMNRGSARRTIIENRQDARFFLSLLAHTVRRGDLEVHAYCLMATHYHLLVRSPEGRLSAAMQWIQDIYARWFNRSRRRDGPLFRGRFRSKLIPGLTYRRIVFHYIHRNPVEARIVARASQYPFGSAYHYARDRGPLWLDRSFGEQFGPAAAYPPPIGRRAAELARRLVVSPVAACDLDDLVGAAPPSVRKWMERKQSLADGRVDAKLLVHPDTLTEAIDSERVRSPGLAACLGRGRPSAWEVLEAGGLRAWSALTMQQIAERTGRSTSTVYKRVRAHAEAVNAVGEYAALAANVLARAIREDHPEQP
jgi:REP element-mobilizing transposase RayT